MNDLQKYLSTCLLGIATLLGGASPASAQVILGAASDFAVLANGTGLTCTDSNVAGPVGVSTSSTPVTSTRCQMQVQVAAGAYADFLTAYNRIATNLGPCTQTFTAADTLAGLTLGSGVYCFPVSATLAGTLTLTGTGPWTFEIGTETGGTGALTATSFRVVGGNPCNVFWWVRKDVTLTTSAFQGTILGGGDITLTGTNPSLAGRVFAKGAVTMTGGNVIGCDVLSDSPSCKPRRHHGHDKDKHRGNDNEKEHKKCNQGVGNGSEGCDPGNSNHGNPYGNPFSSNDERGGKPGDPGRKGSKK